MQKSPRSSRKTRVVEATAYHEAGHAVVAYLLNAPVKRKGATIIPNPEEGSTGCVHAGFTFRRGHRPDENKSDVVRLRCERQAMVLLAGVEAQRKFNRRSVRSYHTQSDFNGAVGLMEYFFESPVLEANLKCFTAWVESLFEQHPYAWQCVKAVATALLEKEQLSGAELQDVIETALGIPRYSRQKPAPSRDGKAA
jgi:ATP-dependent Zn protease